MRRTHVVLLALLLVAVAACGGGGGGGDEAGTTTTTVSTTTGSVADEGTTPTSATGGETTSDGGPNFRTPFDAGFEDLRARFEFAVVEDDVETVTWGWIVEETTDPAAYRMVFVAGPEGSPAEVIAVGDEIWVRVEPMGWIRGSGDTSAPLDPAAPFGFFDAPIDVYEVVGEEEVAGFPTTHYRTIWEVSDLSLLGPALVGTGDVRLTEPVQLTADVWATDEGVVLRMEYRIDATIEENGETRAVGYRARFVVEGVNLGIVIEPPEIEPGPGAVVPLPEGAEPAFAAPGQSLYQVTGMTIDEVVAFYDEALPQAGFAIELRAVQPGAGGAFTASKDGTTYTITIGPGEAGAVAIVIATS